jgi:hypothetical protein
VVKTSRQFASVRSTGSETAADPGLQVLGTTEDSAATVPAAGFIERFSIRGKFQKGNPKETQVQRVRRH